MERTSNPGVSKKKQWLCTPRSPCESTISFFLSSAPNPGVPQKDVGTECLQISHPFATVLQIGNRAGPNNSHVIRLVFVQWCKWPSQISRISPPGYSFPRCHPESVTSKRTPSVLFTFSFAASKRITRLNELPSHILAARGAK